MSSEPETNPELSSLQFRLRWLWLAFIFTLVVAGVLGWLNWHQAREIQQDTNNRLALLSKHIDDLRLTVAENQRAADVRARTVFMDNGLSAAERAEFYHLPEGSEVFPLDWLRALENKNTGHLLINDLESMGFLPDPDNADGLPVGLTSAEARGLKPLGKMVGLNCSACHVGEVHYGGKRLRIDGAPNFLDTRTFFASLVESTFATIEDPDKLLTFVARLKEDRGDHAQVDKKARGVARRLLTKIVGRAEDDVKKVLVPIVKKIIDKEKSEDPLKESKLRDLAKDAKAFREKLLDKFDKGEAKGLLANALVKKAIAAIEKDADQEGTLLHTLEEIYISIRLLKARATFLGKLGKVGVDPRTDWGPGRVDAFGSARAFLFEDGYKPVNPVSYPFIWGLYRIDWFHYDNNTTSILQRNFGQALGVGAVFDPDTLSSTLRPRNLYRLEALATKLHPPKWPEELLGKIDQARASRGAEHFKKHCAACHAAPEPGKMFHDVTFDVEKLGVSPLRAKMFAEDLPKSKKYPDGIKFSKAIGDAMNAVMEQAFKDDNVTDEEREQFKRPPFPNSKPVNVVWRGPGKYATRPLDGVWASGPFLHNGSVPTIDDLLKPAKERPDKFYVGSHEYDPIKLGYVSKVEGKQPNYDTTIDGNQNTGHEYGTELTPVERRELLEYLKTL